MLPFFSDDWIFGPSKLAGTKDMAIRAVSFFALLVESFFFLVGGNENHGSCVSGSHIHSNDLIGFFIQPTPWDWTGFLTRPHTREKNNNQPRVQHLVQIQVSFDH